MCIDTVAISNSRQMKAAALCILTRLLCPWSWCALCPWVPKQFTRSDVELLTQWMFSLYLNFCFTDLTKPESVQSPEKPESALTLTWYRMFLLNLIPLCYFLKCVHFFLALWLLYLPYENLVGLSLKPSWMKLGLSKTLQYLLIPLPHAGISCSTLNASSLLTWIFLSFSPPPL